MAKMQNNSGRLGKEVISGGGGLLPLHPAELYWGVMSLLSQAPVDGDLENIQATIPLQ